MEKRIREHRGMENVQKLQTFQTIIILLSRSNFQIVSLLELKTEVREFLKFEKYAKFGPRFT